MGSCCAGPRWPRGLRCAARPAAATEIAPAGQRLRTRPGGGEAYSLAILLAERARQPEAPPAIQIFATDLDEDAIRTAREGLYPLTIGPVHHARREAPDLRAAGIGQGEPEAMAAGFDAHMTKPVDLRKLSAAVDDLLMRKRKEPARVPAAHLSSGSPAAVSLAARHSGCRHCASRHTPILDP